MGVIEPWTCGPRQTADVARVEGGAPGQIQPTRTPFCAGVFSAQSRSRSRLGVLRSACCAARTLRASLAASPPDSGKKGNAPWCTRTQLRIPHKARASLPSATGTPPPLYHLHHATRTLCYLTRHNIRLSHTALSAQTPPPRQRIRTARRA